MEKITKSGTHLEETKGVKLIFQKISKKMRFHYPQIKNLTLTRIPKLRIPCVKSRDSQSVV